MLLAKEEIVPFLVTWDIFIQDRTVDSHMRLKLWQSMSAQYWGPELRSQPTSIPTTSICVNQVRGLSER